MQIRMLPYDLSVCRSAPGSPLPDVTGFFTLSVTDEEVSLVCETACVPPVMRDREDGWKAFRVTGVLDFSLIGILAGITAVLAEARVGVFVISTYNTDYILVKQNNFSAAAEALSAAGYTLLPPEQ